RLFLGVRGDHARTRTPDLRNETLGRRKRRSSWRRIAPGIGTRQLIPTSTISRSSPQEVDVLLPLPVSLAAILVTIVIDGIAHIAVINFVRREYLLGRAAPGFGQTWPV